jgi:hypothetical protein
MINGLVGIKWNEQYINGRDEQNTSEFWVNWMNSLPKELELDMVT